MTKPLLVVTDVGLIVYWAATALGTISVGKGEVLQAWNWSFLPLDLAAAASGLVWSFLPRANPYRRAVLTISLTLTHTAGLMAIAFFVLWGSWDWTWWAPNLWLALLPLGLGAGACWAGGRAGRPGA
jgi:hypothetical protein